MSTDGKSPSKPLRPPGPLLGPRDGEERPHDESTPVPIGRGSKRGADAAPVPVPAIKGRTIEHLRKHAESRVAQHDALQFEGRVEPLVIDHADEEAALALALIVLENLRRVGGTRIPQMALEGLLGKVLPRLGPKALMELDNEAYELLAWLGRSIDPGLSDPEEPAQEEIEQVDYDPTQAYIDLIRRAIREGFDLVMEYYTGGRGELSTRRVTPHTIKAEKYLHAYCHAREDERVFRLSRIGRLRPVGGRPAPPPERSARPAPARGPHQRALFNDESDGDPR